ncbi:MULTISPECIES: N-acetyl-gamma-glutamyl-phosphate reductase [unclassified Bacillus (in: firmicutes)]|uniref:N-acetyl-gamma-glutamyl-phosphate reductase n=1 Tax=unclassified Bacillus (in: firmicutes) TaxID=185979 RepID=UPI000B88893A|nr:MULTISPECIES: N-acetyl-gamma-glutamyl-phosphate reductase [unclassified Bacillus (in: firmicutes)]
MNVSVIGVTGYSGVELLRLLHAHPEFNIHTMHSTKPEESISNLFPHLTRLINCDLDRVDVDRIAEESDLVFLATPSGVSSELAKGFFDKNIKIIDLSGDLRLKNKNKYEQWYGKEAVADRILEKAVYGLSEWNANEIRNATIVANPGCYPTAVLLGLAPVMLEKAIHIDSLIIDAKSGLTGAGKSPSNDTHFSNMNENFKIYKVNKHQHIPEIEQQLLQWDESTQPITFSTHLMPINRGIQATIYAKVSNGFDTNKMRSLYESMYQNSPFVRIRNKGDFPQVKEVCGSNFCDIGLDVDPRTGRITIVSVIDNLVKGAAGQAIQNANLMFGLNQDVGLYHMPMFP